MKPFLFGILITCLSGCNTPENTYLPDYKGHSGDVSVFMPGNLLESELADIITDSLEMNVSWLAQPETNFDLSFYNSENVAKGGELSRNILIFKIEHEKDPGIEVMQEPPFARGQLYIVLRAKDKEGLIELFQKNAGGLMRTILQREKERWVQVANADLNQETIDKIKTTLGISITLPKKNTQLSVINRQFAWVKRDFKRTKNNMSHWIQQGVIIYHVPYTSTNQFSPAQIIATRDSILRLYVPGPESSLPTFMRTTPDSLFKPRTKIESIEGAYAVELHGYWGITDTTGAFYGIGGPFVSISVHDSLYNRIITVEGYMHAPEFNHREYMRELEALLETARAVK